MMWFSANWINLLLVAVIALITALLIRGMIRDRKTGKSACGGNCACCGVCPHAAGRRCGGCSGCGAVKKLNQKVDFSEGA